MSINLEIQTIITFGIGLVESFCGKADKSGSKFNVNLKFFTIYLTLENKSHVSVAGHPQSDLTSATWNFIRNISKGTPRLQVGNIVEFIEGRMYVPITLLHLCRY